MININKMIKLTYSVSCAILHTGKRKLQRNAQHGALSIKVAYGKDKKFYTKPTQLTILNSFQ